MLQELTACVTQDGFPISFMIECLVEVCIYYIYLKYSILYLMLLISDISRWLDLYDLIPQLTDILLLTTTHASMM